MRVGETGIKSASLNQAQASMIFSGGLGKQGITEGQTYGGCLMGRLSNYDKSEKVRKSIFEKFFKIFQGQQIQQYRQ